MNRSSGKHLRYILVPFFVALIVFFALSMNGSGSGTVTPAYGAEPAVTTRRTTRPTAVSDSAVSPAAPDEETSAPVPIDAPCVVDPDRESPYYIVVYLGSQNVVIYGRNAAGGYNIVEKCFICSSGESGSSTRQGLYAIRRRYEWRLLVGDVYGQYSTGFSPSYLFHSVPYLLENDPSSLDEQQYDLLGSPASHGCIRLCVRDAKWIFDNCPDGTQINIVAASTDLQGQPIPPRIDDSLHAGWDPTDPSKQNPYNSDENVAEPTDS